MATPQNTSARKAGVLPIGPTQAQAQNQADTPKSTRAKSTATQDGVKAKIRWLPPGLTEEEFVNILGEPWGAGKGKVSWFRFQQGHVPKSASKDPTPGWALLQVKEEDLEALAQAVRDSVWEDAKGTFNSPSLIGPPYVERAIYKKIPAGKPKKDPKEGTIDQDDEWQKFLVSLTEDPDAKKDEGDAAVEESTATEANAKPSVTNLVAHILEAKANKAKESANAKSRKHARQESQGKGKGAAASSEEPKKKSKEKSDKPKETVKILKKQAATEAAADAAKAVAKDIKTRTATSETSGRRNLGIGDILRRDLGLAGPSSRKTRQEAAAAKSTPSEAQTKEAKSQDSGSNTATPSSAQAAESPPAPAAQKAQGEKSSRGGRRRGKESKGADSKAAGPSETPAVAPAKPPVILQKKKEETTAPPPAKETTSASKSATKGNTAATPPTGPKAGNNKGNQSGGSQKKGAASAPSAGATRAFLKHANPSQGVTETLLKEAMGAFGSVSSVEIDRKKGFAYVDFAEHTGLLKAMAASPVSIANATVQVLERKDQTPKKATATATTASSGGAQPSAAKDTRESKASDSASRAATPASVSAEKANGEQQQPAKRSRRRGRGKGGNGAASGNAENKAGDQGGSSSKATTSAPAAPSGDAPSAG